MLRVLLAGGGLMVLRIRFKYNTATYCLKMPVFIGSQADTIQALRAWGSFFLKISQCLEHRRRKFAAGEDDHDDDGG